VGAGLPAGSRDRDPEAEKFILAFVSDKTRKLASLPPFK